MSVIVLAAITVVLPYARLNPDIAPVLATTTAVTPTPTPRPFSGTTEREPNNTWTQAQTNGYISLNHNTIYSGTLDGNATTGDDNYYLKVTAPINRKFTLSIPSGNLNGVQLVIYSMPAGTPVASDQTAPFEVSYNFSTPGDYEFKVYAAPTANNRSQYTFTITDPGIVACPWSAPISNTILPGAGPLQSAGNYIIGQTLFQTLFRNNQSYARTVPIVNNVPNFSAATAWVPNTNASTFPGTGPIVTQSEYVIGNMVYQGIWRGNANVEQGFSRQIPIINGTPAWNCYSTPQATATPTPYPPLN